MQWTANSKESIRFCSTCVLLGTDGASEATNAMKKILMAGKPVSRILLAALTLPSARHGDHSSSPGLAAGIQQPTRGFILPCDLRHTKESALLRTNSVSRASSPLLFGLAPRGVCRAPDVAIGAVGSYPTVSPLPSSGAFRNPLARAAFRLSDGFPPDGHRGALHWRFIFCGTVRSQNLVWLARTARRVGPLALPGALPFSLRRPASKILVLAYYCQDLRPQT